MHKKEKISKEPSKYTASTVLVLSVLLTGAVFGGAMYAHNVGLISLVKHTEDIRVAEYVAEHIEDDQPESIITDDFEQEPEEVINWKNFKKCEVSIRSEELKKNNIELIIQGEKNNVRKIFIDEGWEKEISLEISKEKIIPLPANDFQVISAEGDMLTISCRIPWNEDTELNDSWNVVSENKEKVAHLNDDLLKIARSVSSHSHNGELYHPEMRELKNRIREDIQNLPTNFLPKTKISNEESNISSGANAIGLLPPLNQ